MPRTLRIVDYDPAWRDQYEREREVITGALGDQIVRVEHIGSTSVPELGAKPTIDVLLGIDSLETFDRDGIHRLVAAGYEYVPKFENEMPYRRYFRRWNDTLTDHTVHIHTVEPQHPFWQRHLDFRDYLRAHPDVARQYAALKRTLVQRFAHDSAAYTDGKTTFIQDIEHRARQWRRR